MHASVQTSIDLFIKSKTADYKAQRYSVIKYCQEWMIVSASLDELKKPLKQAGINQRILKAYI